MPKNKVITVQNLPITISKEERFQILQEIAEYQMQILSVADKIACIEEKNEV